MKYLDEYRDAAAAHKLAAAIRATVTRPWNLMEVCGGQTHSILRFGLDQLLPDSLRLIHGPGCPVCVTPLEMIDKALALAEMPQVTLCSFGDMLRVPGSAGDLQSARSRGGDVRIVYSPLDAVRLARALPEREVVFFAIGFETTAPANAMAVLHAEQLGLTNFSLLVSHVLVPPALRAILTSPSCLVHGFLAAGHVCTIMGAAEYAALAAEFHVPIVITGFEPVDLLRGVQLCVGQLERGEARVENPYARVAHAEGNAVAQEKIFQVFEPADRSWRGVGRIAQSGWRLRAAYRAFDAEIRFGLPDRPVAEPRECLAGEVLQGHKRPIDCAAFGTRCTPLTPLGAPMVSSEGACAAYYRYRGGPRPAGDVREGAAS